jgi:two-component system cell cycle response regulator
VKCVAWHYRHVLRPGKLGCTWLANQPSLGYPVLVGTVRPFPKAVVVVADHDRATCEHICKVLRALGVTAVSANTGQKAIDAVRAGSIDLVVLDVNLPGLSGTDACRVIKTITKDRFVPVVLLTGPDERGNRRLGSQSCGDDQLAKPFDDDELVARVETMLRVKRAHDDVQCAKTETRYASLHRGLRSLPDRRHFHECLAREFDEAQRHLDPLACCIVAVDDFRKLASVQGADVSAQVLREVYERIKRTIRTTDLAAQFRTAEFGLLLPNTRPGRALTLADRLVSEVALHPLTIGDESIDLTIALGVGLFPSGKIRSHSELLDAASIAVARARVAGPNRVCVVQQQGYIFRPTLPGAA